MGTGCSTMWSGIAANRDGDPKGFPAFFDAIRRASGRIELSEVPEGAEARQACVAACAEDSNCAQHCAL